VGINEKVTALLKEAFALVMEGKEAEGIEYVHETASYGMFGSEICQRLMTDAGISNAGNVLILGYAKEDAPGTSFVIGYSKNLDLDARTMLIDMGSKLCEYEKTGEMPQGTVETKTTKNASDTEKEE